ncbi:MAG: TVP38/TMEM64 family protein [Leptolyngbyaceae cyanobacterium T60_A2020_046]|nr:TVP38/TMEM64 family protein [Leptolyngbyaceae cyanobacterium T60_A2020_046]
MAILRKPTFWLLVMLGCGIAIYGRQIRSLLDFQAVFGWLCVLGHWTVPAFVGAHVLATVIGIPGTVLVLAGGIKFGLWWGTLWSLMGATLGAIAAFWVARYLLKDWFRDRFGRHRLFRRMDKILDTHSFYCVLAVRFAPVSPFNLVNFLFGLTSVSTRAYALGTLIGIAPGTLIYTWLGRAGEAAIAGQGVGQLGLALLGLTGLSLLPLLWRRRTSSSP